MKIISLLLFSSTCIFGQIKDSGSLSGGGNFRDGIYDNNAKNKINVLKSNHLGMLRINLYPNTYYNKTKGIAKTESIDSIMNLLYEANITPMILFEYYSNYNDLGKYDKWKEIGSKFAERWQPNSKYLVSNGIKNWGITVYTAINEPDMDNEIPKTKADSVENYYDALEGLADGVHSVNNNLKVCPGGWMSENAFSDHKIRGYGTAIAPLLNNGKLDGIDLHTYNDISFAPIIKSNGNATYNWSPQSDFDDVKNACGITRDINFYSTEYNFKSNAPGVTEELAAKRLLTFFWANLGVVKNDGKTQATQYALVWNLFNLADSDENYGMSTQSDPWKPTVKGKTYIDVVALSGGMEYKSLDPKGTGTYILSGSGKKLWVWQNYQFWSNVNGTSFTIKNIPSGTTKIDVYGWEGLRKSIAINNKTELTITGLEENETYMFLGNKDDSNVTEITYSDNLNSSSIVQLDNGTIGVNVKNKGNYKITLTSPSGQLIAVIHDDILCSGFHQFVTNYSYNVAICSVISDNDMAMNKFVIQR